MKSVPAIKKFISDNLGKSFEETDIERVIQKLDSTESRILKEEVPYLRDAEYSRLIEHKKQKKKRAR